MVTPTPRAKRLESTVSSLLLLIIILVAAGILIKQSDYNMGRFGIKVPDTAPAKKTEPDVNKSAELSNLAPAGFNPLSETETYDSNNLFEKINGKAPFYTESGFAKLTTRRFVSRTDENLGMELYIFDMGALRNAFSVYSRQKRPDSTDIPELGFAYSTENAFYMTAGRFYIEIVGWAQSQQLFDAMTETANKIRGKFASDEKPLITELDFFPAENLRPKTHKLYLSGVFGFDGLIDTFTAEYEVNGQTATCFLSKKTDPAEAQAAAESYFKFLIENGAQLKQTNEPVIKQAEGRVVDFYGDFVIVFSTGDFLGGVQATPSRQSAEKLAVKLIEKLKASDGNE
jgi:hypothetical protein